GIGDRVDQRHRGNLRRRSVLRQEPADRYKPAMLVNGAKLAPDPSGALWWPERATLIVADLHFEKASAFARRGVFLPPYDSVAALAALEAALQRYEASTVICL